MLGLENTSELSDKHASDITVYKPEASSGIKEILCVCKHFCIFLDFRDTLRECMPELVTSSVRH